MCKQLNEPALKSVKPKRFGAKSEKKKVGLRPGQIFVFYFGPGRSGPDLKNPASADLSESYQSESKKSLNVKKIEKE